MQALWMLLGSLAFSLMAVCVKFASEHFHSSEVVFWRGALGILIIYGIARAQRVSLRTRHIGMHAWRSVVGVASLGAWFYAIAGLPLATAITLNYMSSVWLAAFLVGGTLIAKVASRPGVDLDGRATEARSEAQTASLQGLLSLAVLAGFAGVVLMLRPTIGQEQVFAGLVGLFSGIGAAFAYMQVTALARIGEPELRTVFYFMVGTTIAGAASMPLTGLSPWSGWEGLWMLPMASLAALGQWCMTRAYSAGATLVVANLQYCGIVYGAIFSVLLFDERLDAPAWAGMALIVASGIASTVLRARASAAPRDPS